MFWILRFGILICAGCMILCFMPIQIFFLCHQCNEMFNVPTSLRQHLDHVCITSTLCLVTFKLRQICMCCKLLLTHLPLAKMTTISQTMFSEAFSLMKKISMKFVPKGPIDNKPALFQIMAWRQTGDKPLSKPMLTWFTFAYEYEYIVLS